MSDPRKTSRDLFQTSSFPSPLATPPAATLVAPRSSPDGCHELWKKEEKRGTEREKLATGGSHLRREERGGAGGRVAIVPCDSSENRFEIDLFLSSERHFRMHDRDRVVIPWKKIKIFFLYTLRNVARVSPYIYTYTHTSLHRWKNSRAKFLSREREREERKREGDVITCRSIQQHQHCMYSVTGPSTAPEAHPVHPMHPPLRTYIVLPSRYNHAHCTKNERGRRDRGRKEGRKEERKEGRKEERAYSCIEHSRHARRKPAVTKRRKVTYEPMAANGRSRDASLLVQIHLSIEGDISSAKQFSIVPDLVRKCSSFEKRHLSTSKLEFACLYYVISNLYYVYRVCWYE